MVYRKFNRFEFALHSERKQKVINRDLKQFILWLTLCIIYMYVVLVVFIYASRAYLRVTRKNRKRDESCEKCARF